MIRSRAANLGLIALGLALSTIGLDVWFENLKHDGLDFFRWNVHDIFFGGIFLGLGLWTALGGWNNLRRADDTHRGTVTFVGGLGIGVLLAGAAVAAGLVANKGQRATPGGDASGLQGTFAPDAISKRWLRRQGFGGLSPTLLLRADRSFELVNVPKCVVVWMPDCGGGTRSEKGRWGVEEGPGGTSIVLEPDGAAYRLKYSIIRDGRKVKIRMPVGSIGDAVELLNER
jgi:hypothetical protein